MSLEGASIILQIKKPEIGEERFRIHPVLEEARQTTRACQSITSYKIPLAPV